MPQLSATDQMGNTISLHSPPQRIISLVPSQTELLFSLGLGERVVGITKFCVHPAHWRDEKKIIGGTKNFDLTMIDRLNPDLILGNKEENYEAGILALQRKYPVWMSDIIDLDDSMEMIASVGELTDATARANQIITDIQDKFEKLDQARAVRVLYLIWRKPWMAAGKNTFIDCLLGRNGFENVINTERYPTLSSREIKLLNPDVVLLSSEPFPFNEEHRAEIHEILPHSNPVLVDGEMFSWYGSRLMFACDYFRNLRLNL